MAVMHIRKKVICLLSALIMLSASTSVFAADVHDMVYTPAKQATEESDGNREYWTCRICGKIFLDADGNEETMDSKVITKLFKYIHDPSENPEAMKDIIKDENAVYGFRPSETGSLKAYAAADWSDPDIVETGRQERIAYHNSIEVMYDMLRQMQNEGKSIEEIARAVSEKRNNLRLEAYKEDPEGLATLKQRNLEKYGHEEGPLPDELFAQYGSWETVMEKAFSANVGMDACLGLYDDYYDLYVILGQVEDDISSDPDYAAIETDLADSETAVADPAVQTENSTEAFVSPPTGDNCLLAFWITLLIISTGGTMAILVTKKFLI